MSNCHPFVFDLSDFLGGTSCFTIQPSKNYEGEILKKIENAFNISLFFLVFQSFVPLTLL